MCAGGGQWNEGHAGGSKPAPAGEQAPACVPCLTRQTFLKNGFMWEPEMALP